MFVRFIKIQQNIWILRKSGDNMQSFYEQRHNVEKCISDNETKSINLSLFIYISSVRSMLSTSLAAADTTPCLSRLIPPLKLPSSTTL